MKIKRLVVNGFTFLLCAFLLTLALTTAFAGTIRVPTDYTTIQSAILAANDGDTIQVAQGVYAENITLTSSKHISIQGGWSRDFTSRSDDSALTIIDGAGNGQVINIRADPGITIKLTIEGFTIQNGAAERGGGIRALASGSASTITLLVTNNKITGNISNNRGGGISIESFEGLIDATLTNNTILKNSANNEGGGIRVESGNEGVAVVTLTQNVITKNTVTHLVEIQGGWDGGGIAAFTSGAGTTTLTLEKNLITENEAGFGGGVFGYAWGGSNAIVTIGMTNNIISGNMAISHGGAIFSCSGTTCPITTPGGSVLWSLNNNTITGNTAQIVGGIDLISGSTFGEGGLISLSMKNDIVWGNTETDQNQRQLVFEGESGVTTGNVSYSNVGFISCYGVGAYTSDNLINQEPLFVDPEADDYHLMANSPCVDTGTAEGAPNTDIDGTPRPQGNGYDMGAYELKKFVYISNDGSCGDNIPCYSTIQEGIASEYTAFTMKIGQGTYNEDVIIDQPKQISFQGGWDSTFTSPSGETKTNSMTISDGMVVLDEGCLTIGD